MDDKHEVDPNGMTPDPEPAPAADKMEQAQKDAAEKRLQGGGYGG
ncbi:MAG TPA: hypothetical protein VEZ70_04035 [Allosphingosinicella sp.]|nr:hypothetical protein [Allosphingosinicella sp.]